MIMKNDSDLTASPRAPLEGSIVRCYRYMSGFWKEALRDSRLKLSAAVEFNDAFDGSGTCIGEFSDEAIRRHLMKFSSSMPPEWVKILSDRFILPVMRREYSEKMARCFIERVLFKSQKILCFSNPPTTAADSLMWSHYANKWQGVRLGFDLLFENHHQVTYDTTSPYALTPVTYSQKRPVLDLSRIEEVDGDPLYSRYLYDVFRTKAEPWRYENEWRLFCDEQYSTECDGMRFWDFNKALLRTIDIGPNVDAAHQEQIIEISKTLYPHVEVRKVIMSDSDYDFVYRTVVQPRIELPAESSFVIHDSGMLLEG